MAHALLRRKNGDALNLTDTAPQNFLALMSFYHDRILPHLINLAMRNRRLVPYRERALGEMHRVLKPSGHLLFEHGSAPEDGVRKMAGLANAGLKKIAGGCHLNGPIGNLIERAGYRIERLEIGYMKGPKPMTFIYEGSARRG